MESEKTSGGDKYSKLAGNTIIFAISSFSSKLLTLIVQPFLTYAMAEISDLGLSKILSQYANLLIPFVSNAIIRFGLDKGNSEKQVFTNGLLTILGGFGILVLCWPVAQFLPDMAQYGLLIYIYVLMSCLRTLCTQFVRSRQWNKLVAVDGHHQRRLRERALPDVHRQALGFHRAEGHQQDPLEADAPLLAAHDTGPDKLLDHQRLRFVLCA